MNNKESTKRKKIIEQSGAQDLFDKWNQNSKILAGDSSTVILKKISIRILGILLFLMFSPILLAIFILVLAVSL